MALVAYPDSDLDSEDADQGSVVAAQRSQAASKTAAKRKHSGSLHNDLPPLPASFHDLYSTSARVSTSDDPNLHGGRKRTVPHVEGNWPSHVYLEWIPTQTEASDLHNLIQHVKDSLQCEDATRVKKLPIPEIVPSLQSELGASLPLHVSLSQALQIKTEDREVFIETLERSLRKAAVRTFHYSFHSLKWVPNFERNRWFLVLNIAKPAQDELNRLLNACNRAAKDCGHSGLYTGGEGDGPMVDTQAPKRKKSDEHADNHVTDHTAYFHVSIAWNLEEPDPDWITLVQNFSVKDLAQPPEAAFNAVKVKVGNKVHSIALGAQRPSIRDGGLLGL